jgi:hypothetical protein
MDKFSAYIQSDFDRCVILLNNTIATATVHENRTLTFTSEYDSITIDRDTLLNSRREYSDMLTTRVFTVNGNVYRLALLQDAYGAMDRITGQLYDYD